MIAAEEIIKLKSPCTLTDLDIIGDLLQPMDAGKDFVTGNNNYIWFYLIGFYFKPVVIVEFGTRFGYSMKSFLNWGYSSEFEIWSYDNESDGVETLDIFKDYFINKLNIRNINIIRADTRGIARLDIPNRADLVMVDGCHTTEGCYRECKLGYDALRVGGVLVVDDVNYDKVAEGAEKFCAEMGLEFNYLPSLNGIYLIEKK